RLQLSFAAADTTPATVKSLRQCGAWTKGTLAVSANSRIRPAAKFFLEGDKKFFVKGVTYGPFKPDAEGNYLGRPEQVDVDLALMRQAGLNVVRIYHSPPPWFLDRCTNAGMRVLVTLPW